MDDIKNIIESLLFAADEPLSIDRLKKIITDVNPQELREALDELRADYEARQGGFYLKEVANGYQIRTRPDYKEYIKRLLQPRVSARRLWKHWQSLPTNNRSSAAMSSIFAALTAAACCGCF
jgi:chromosome segregation and condensation protein ScpB